MLQPLQLEDVSARHAEDVAELRDFFQKAGLPVETPAALHAVVDRLRADRTFHRDLTAHVWVLLDRAGQRAAYPDMLAVVALAAAGAALAPNADEADAHDLLRFLMGAIRSLDAGEDASAFRPSLTDRAAGPTAVRAVAASSNGQQHGRLVWAAVAVCLLAVLALGVLLYRRPGAGPVANATSGAVAPPDAVSGLAAGEGTPSAPDEAARALPPATTGTPLRRQGTPSRTMVLPTRDGHPGGVAALVPSAPAVSEMHGGSSLSSVATPTLPAMESEPLPARTAPAGSTRAAVPSGTLAKVVPADILSRRLGARSVPAYAGEDDVRNDVNGHRIPRLLRRHPAGAWQAGTETELVAELQPSSRPGAIAARAASSSGVVRSESLGITAGNVLYSPAPAYPAAASAAHVQGEVKLQAEVDRDGNVTDARVVSGPPLLRDAALNAVQHWRYRPWLSHGKPVPMTAAALLEFELP